MSSFTPLFTLLSEIEAPRWTESKLYRMLPGVLFAIMATVVGDAYAVEKPSLTELEIAALLGRGLSVSSTDMQGGKIFTGRVPYAPDGTLSGTLIHRQGTNHAWGYMET